MQQIREHNVKLGTNSVPLPLGARVVGVTACGNTLPLQVVITVLSDTAITAMRNRSIAVQIDGDRVDTSATYIGSATANSSRGAWHVFELRSA